MAEELKDILIVAIIPYFLDKGISWFGENMAQIKKAQKSQAFWQDNSCFLEKGQEIGLSELLRKIDEMGYEKVFKTDSPGEFSQTGGVLEIFPINSHFAVRLDFLGNKIEQIEKLNIVIENEEISKNILKKKLKSQKLFSDLKNLKPGDYLTHLDHGIGRFLGIAKREKEKGIEGVKLLRPKEFNSFYELEYTQGDKLFVPVGLERKLSRYIGFTEPKLSRLGGVLWQKTKKKIKEEAEKFARELLKMFAEKETTTREPYKQNELSETLETSFKYKLTPDQAQSIEEIAKDLSEKKPMDRIVCGDVGFGKTEVALRAAVIAAENGSQAALIAPTTILASQHYNTFKERLAKLPFKVALLSRLVSKKDQQEIIKGLKTGEIDIVIGTHSILGRNVIFNNLGLLIIDDEQRFGVKQKEKLRKIKPEIDVLYLSATPIPRTLYMALSSLKDISLIQTPPEGRKAIKTFILPFKKEIIKKAIENELKRDGQIYFLHNRIETIIAFKEFLEELNTKAKIGILHAKLPEKEIIKILNAFEKKEIDLLLSTTIIENGLDITTANTLIVDNATKLGLAQAYQLRGRVGRSSAQSFAYFLYPKKQLKGLAKKRLEALKQAEELGSGYRIATADLEIRGAGNILGREQSGSVNRIGLNLYCQMLSEAVEKLKNET